ncbi:hypothetical protein [Pelotomaculum propionicicum]|uniref:hypothetical protein n=1 Tax=Pelotomaculum propionicicum TaxID=258475 RepID=UPI003B9ED819
MPHERIEWLEQNYIRAEKIRLEAWSMLQSIRKDIEKHGFESEISIEKMINSHAEYDGKTLKIVVDDYLPRKCLLGDKKAVLLLRQMWQVSIARPINQLQKDREIRFNQAHCIIVPYIPRDCIWDVDNRVFKFIPDALKYTGIVATDSWSNMSVSIIGGVDKENPRTEIYVEELSNKFPELATAPAEKIVRQRG